MAVAKSAVSAGVATTTCSSATHTVAAASTLTVGAGDTFLIMGVELDSTTPGTGVAHWDSAGSNQLMTLLGTIITEGTTTAKALALFGLVNPTAGNKAATHSFSGQSAAVNGYVWFESFTGSVTSSVAAAIEGYATNSGASGTTASVASGVAIPTGDMAVAYYVNIAGFNNAFTPGTNPGDGGTAIGQNQTLTTNASAEYYSGAGAVITASAAQANGAWAAVIVGIKAPSAATVVAQDFGQFFENPKLKRLTDYGFVQGPFAGTSPPLASTFATSSLFEPVKLKRPSEFTQGPFAGTSPPLSGTFATSPFFEQVKLKQPIINIPDITPPEPIRLAGERWFEQVRLKRPAIDNPPILFTPTIAAVTANIVEQPFFEVVRLKRPSEFTQGPLVVAVVNFAAANWFDQVRLFKVPERFQEAFGTPFRTSQPLQAWFDAVQKLKVPGDFPFTAAGAAQASTIQNALMDWFPQLRMRRATVETPLVVYFPAQVSPSAPAVPHNLQFHATVGRLKSF